MTSLEGRVLRRKLAVDASNDVRSELWIWQQLASRLDSPSTFSAQTSEVDELCRASEGGLARLVPVTARHRGAPAQVGGTLTLITGRLLEHYQSGTQTRRVWELYDAQPEARLQLHPATAEQLGIGDEAWVEVSNDRGTVRCRAQVSTDIRFDTVFLPFHFSGDQRSNVLTNDETDPISGMPEFKKTTVRVRALVKAGALV
ncbi:molybdopterin oxidoreductase family protein [Cryobacterium ruanii]|uniref:molybdopterin oxidoreductase family protein n=1 Tax=Cryobacterium ruanii TaxID=1259197 RepID=UPI0030CC2935